MCLRDGFIDFEDIELYALKLLSSRTGVRATKHLLVDEFQDTSQIQWGLLYRMAEEQFSGQAWKAPTAPHFSPSETLTSPSTASGRRSPG